MPGPVVLCEGVASPQQREAGPEHLGTGRGLGAFGLSALHVLARRGEPGREPSDHTEPVQHAAGVPEVRVDGGLAGPRSVAGHDLGAAAPAASLLHQERRQRSRAAVLDHRQSLAGVGAGDHRHIAAPLAHRGLIDQQHPAPAAAAPLGHQSRPSVHQGADRVPAHTVAARRRAERHHPASATIRRARRAASAPPKAWQPSKKRLPPLPQTIRLRCHTSVTGLPDTSRPRIFLARRSCTRWHLNPHCAHRRPRTADSTSTTSSPAVSVITPSTRICGR